MQNIFRFIFKNRFCCGWISACISFFTIAVLKYYDLDKWWVVLMMFSIFYLWFRRLAFKYLDE